MSSGLTASGRNVALDAIARVARFLSVHDVKGPDSSESEPRGGTPEYERRAARWQKASGGELALEGTYSWDVPAGFVVRSVGLWSAAERGVLYGYFDVADEVYSGQGVHQLTSGSITLRTGE